MPILRDFELVLDADDVLRAQGGDPADIRARRPAFVELAERALVEAMPLLQPAVAYQHWTVEGLTHERLSLAGGGMLSGPLVSQHLAPASEVVTVVCTAGSQLEDHAAQVLGTDAVYGLAIEGVGSAAAEALAAAACHHIEVEAEAVGLKATIPISPGMVGWPVHEGQHQIFDLLTTAEIGVRLMPSGMMIPRKSLSLVIGLGVEVSSEGIPCDYCSMRDRCRYKAH